MQAPSHIAHFSSQDCRAIRAGRSSQYTSFGKGGSAQGKPWLPPFSLSSHHCCTFVPLSPSVQSSGRAPGKSNGAALLGKSIGTKISTWIQFRDLSFAKDTADKIQVQLQIWWAKNWESDFHGQHCFAYRKKLKTEQEAKSYYSWVSLFMWG